MADNVRPHRGITFKCPCGCDTEYDVPLPDGWILVPDHLTHEASTEFVSPTGSVDPARLKAMATTGNIAIANFLHYYGSTKAKGIPTNG